MSTLTPVQEGNTLAQLQDGAQQGLQNAQAAADTFEGRIVSVLGNSLVGAATPYLFTTVLTPLGGALFCGTQAVASHIIRSALERVGCGPGLTSIISFVASYALAAVVTGLALEVTWTFGAVVVFALQTFVTALAIGLAVAAPFVLIGLIALVIFSSLTH